MRDPYLLQRSWNLADSNYLILKLSNMRVMEDNIAPWFTQLYWSINQINGSWESLFNLHCLIFTIKLGYFTFHKLKILAKLSHSSHICICIWKIHTFFNKSNTKISNLALFENIVNKYFNTGWLIQRTINCFKFFWTFSSCYLAFKLENHCCSVDTICLSILFAEKAEVRHLLYWQSSSKLNCKIVNSFRFNWDTFLFFSLKIFTSFNLDPIVHSFRRWVFNLNTSWHSPPKFTRKYQRWSFG